MPVSKQDPGTTTPPVYMQIWTDTNPGALNARIETFLKDGNHKAGFKLIQALQSQSSVYDPEEKGMFLTYTITIFYTF